MPMQPKLTGAENLLGASLPSRRDEAWKWTDVRGKVSESAGGLTASALPKFTLPDGVTLSEGEGESGQGALSALAKSFAPKSFNIHVPAGAAPSAPLVIEDLSRGHARIAIRVEKGASLSVIEHHSAPSGSFTNIDLSVHLAGGASLTRTIIHNDPDDAARIATANIAMETDAKIEQYALSFGGALTRLETRLSGEGEQISAVINGAYLLSDKRHCDMTSHIDLAQPHAHIRQAVKGVVTDKSRGVFQGKFHVERPAQHTDAEMRHDALMLSDTAQVRAKPELEIYADDVACAHGNTIGQLDESALFYMRQRGIPLKSARALLMQAFVTDVFDDMADEDLKAQILGQIEAWLEA